MEVVPWSFVKIEKVSSLSGPRVLRYVWIAETSSASDGCDCLVVTLLISIRLSAKGLSATVHDVKIADLG